MAKTLSNFDDFKKGIHWYKSCESWCGSFPIAKTQTTEAFCYSVNSMPGQAARSAKPEIAQRLYLTVQKYCFDNHLDFKTVIKTRLAEITGTNAK